VLGGVTIDTNCHLRRMVYAAYYKDMKTRLHPDKQTMLRDAKTTSIAERMRRPPLGGDIVKGGGGPTFFTV
jgi:hypothetical protein